MSPEQIKGNDLDTRTDLFSFGIVLYEMATGKLPFDATSPVEILTSILRDPSRPPSLLNPQIGPELENLINKAIEKDCNLRYQHASAIRSDLQRLKRNMDLFGTYSRPHTRCAPLVDALERTVAVLYFENLDGRADNDYFRDGMTEDIITELSRLNALRVFPRAAVLPYRDRPITANDVHAKLGAAYILSGGIRRSGKRIRVTTQLVDARSGHTLWAERYDRQLEDIFIVQEDIAQSIRQALQGSVRSPNWIAERIQAVVGEPDAKQRSTQRPTVSIEAYDSFLRGRGYRRQKELELAVEMFEKAVDLDPAFAVAHAALANVCAMQFEVQHRTPSWLEKARAAMDRAFRLKPDLPEVFAARARLSIVQRDYMAARQDADTAIAMQFDCEGAWECLGVAFFSSDQFEQAAALAQRAVYASGDDYNVYPPYLMALRSVGRSEEELELRQRMTSILMQQLQFAPEDARALILLAVNNALIGQERESHHLLANALALRPKDPTTLYNAACGYAVMKMKTEALAALQKAREAGWDDLEWLRRDTDLLCLHGEPAFELLIHHNH
jgi:non-specific serine/threonine protein kinase